MQMPSIKVRTELRELDKIRSFLKRQLDGLDLEEQDVYKIELSLVEMCTNIIRYAYPREKGEIVIKAWREKGDFCLEIRDGGIPFDPRQVKRPTLEEMINREQMGGLGIFLARKLMDRFSYRREDDQNVLTMSYRAAAKKRKRQ